MPPGSCNDGTGKPGMPIAPRVRDTQSREMIMHSSAKLSETIAKA